MSHEQKNTFDLVLFQTAMRIQELTEFSSERDSGNRKNFARSSAFAEVCGLRLLLVIIALILRFNHFYYVYCIMTFYNMIIFLSNHSY